MFDQVILVDSNDCELGVMDKIEAHRGDARLHRAISVFLFNEKNELLVQRRSAYKIVGAGQWANTCCGNVRPGETYQACAHRRLEEELGIKGVKLKQISKFEYQTRCNEEFSEHEMDTLFVGTYSGDVHPNPLEVTNVRWEPWKTFVSQVKKNDPRIAPWVPYLLPHVISTIGE